MSEDLRLRLEYDFVGANHHFEDPAWSAGRFAAIEETGYNATILAVMAEERRQMDEVVQAMATSFDDVQATIDLPDKRSALFPLQAIADQQINRISKTVRRARDDKFAALSGFSNAAEEYAELGADETAYEDRLDAAIYLVLGKADAERDRDKKVSRRAFWTSVRVSSIGVVLSALVGFGAGYVNKGEERSYQQHEDIRRRVIPQLTAYTLVAGRFNVSVFTLDSLKARTDELAKITDSLAVFDLTNDDRIAKAYGTAVSTNFKALVDTTHAFIADARHAADSPRGNAPHGDLGDRAGKLVARSVELLQAMSSR